MQVDADYKLKDMKKHYKELEIKGNGYKKKLDELQIALAKQIEQYGLIFRMFVELRHASSDFSLVQNSSRFGGR